MMRRNVFLFLSIICVCLFVLISCTEESDDDDVDDDDQQDDDDDDGGLPGVRVFFSTSAPAGFFDAPYPIEFMRRDDGTIRFSRFKNTNESLFLDHYMEQADTKTNGFSCVSAVYMRFTGPLNADALPATPIDSLSGDAKVFAINIDPNSAGLGDRVPLRFSFKHDAGTYTPPDLLAMMPPIGYTLEPDTLYAAVVLRTLGDSEGDLLGSPPEIEMLKRGETPPGFHGPQTLESFEHLWPVLEAMGTVKEDVAAATVFRTGNPVAQMQALQQAVSELPDPTYWSLGVIDEFDDYYVLEGKTVVPIWQNGNRNYFLGGGEIVFVDGRPVMQWEEQIRFSLTVPKREMPDGGFPLLFYANGAAGTYLQVVNRGTTEEQEQGIKGRGPALYLTRRGIGTLDIECATVGPRSPFGDYSDLYFFNFLNLVAFRDNVRQAASEFTMLPKMARHIRIPSVLCPETDSGGRDITFDTDNFFFWGHSTGASIGDLVLAVEPSYKAGLLSGAGATWVQNLTMKEHPFPFKYLVGALLNMPTREFDDFHPVATMFQTLCEPAEAAVFAPLWIDDPPGDQPSKDVLLIGGYIDGYFLPDMINGLTLAGGLDAAEPIVDPGILDYLELSGRSVVPTPVSENIETSDGAATGVLAQYLQPYEIDGHYVPFELNTAKYQYSCFLNSAATVGYGILPAPDEDPFAPCEFGEGASQ